MRATKRLPEGYRALSEIDLSKNERVSVLLNLLALPFLFAFGWLFLVLTHALREREPPPRTFGWRLAGFRIGQ